MPWPWLSVGLLNYCALQSTATSELLWGKSRNSEVKCCKAILLLHVAQRDAEKSHGGALQTENQRYSMVQGGHPNGPHDGKPIVGTWLCGHRRTGSPVGGRRPDGRASGSA